MSAPPPATAPRPCLWTGLLVVALLGMIGLTSSTSAQAPSSGASEIDQIRRQLQEATDHLNNVVQEQQRIIQDLQKRLDAMEATKAAPAAQETAPGPTTVAEVPAASAPASPTVSSPSWRPSDPIRLQRGAAYLDLGLVATFAAGGSTEKDIEGELELGGHDPNQRGFTVQGIETTFSGAVDPYFTGLATVTFALDSEGETHTELEEAYLQSLALPANLQLRAGQYFSPFGRHNPTHLHTWSFVDTPLVNGRFLGPDGLRNPGAQLSWLAPTPFYSDLMFSVQNSQGETASSFRGGGGHHHAEEEDHVPFAYRDAANDRGLSHVDDLLLGPRYAASFDLTDHQVLLLGASAALGPNDSGGPEAGSTDTQIYGADLTWRWKSPRHMGGFPFLQWQTEGMWRRYDAGTFDWALDGDGDILDPATGQPAVLAGERLEDYGLYSQFLYGFRKAWVAGLRFDYATSREADYEKRALLTVDGDNLGRDPARAPRWRLSPNLTWYPTEYSKFRLQYNYDDRKGIGQDHSVWLQFEFVLGAHAAHTF